MSDEMEYEEDCQFCSELQNRVWDLEISIKENPHTQILAKLDKIIELLEKPEPKIVGCHSCDAMGVITMQSAETGRYKTSMPCPNCAGKGWHTADET